MEQPEFLRTEAAEWTSRKQADILLSSEGASSVSIYIYIPGSVLIKKIIDHFDVLDSANRPILTEREILRILEAVVSDAENVPLNEVAGSSMGVLTTENRKVWNNLRNILRSNEGNKECLQVVDDALFIVCLDDVAPESTSQLCSNFLCGTYQLKDGVQIGTCTNRWYDKVCALFITVVSCD